VEKGISSISLNPDTVLQTTHTILEAEEALRPNGNGRSSIPATLANVPATIGSFESAATFGDTVIALRKL
jgi:hypothetical protein